MKLAGDPTRRARVAGDCDATGLTSLAWLRAQRPVARTAEELRERAWPGVPCRAEFDENPLEANPA